MGFFLILIYQTMFRLMLFSCACDKFKWNRVDGKLDRSYLYFHGPGKRDLDAEELDFVTYYSEPVMFCVISISMMLFHYCCTDWTMISTTNG